MSSEAETVTLMKILSNVSRLKILRIIYNAKKDLCVNEISQLARISQSLASHQLAYLSAHGVVEGHRMGQTMCYVPAKNELSKTLLKVLNLFSGER
jgi:DNA-binding transcriptional ArsR family regulator